MSTTSYEFAQSGTNYWESTGSGMSGTTFWVYAHTTVSNIKVSASQKDENQDSFVRMVLTTGDGITTQETKQIYGGRSDCSFSSTLSVNQNTWFNITFYTTNAYLYGDGLPVTIFISTGWTGNTSTPANRELYSCKFTITYDPIWVVDAQNDGYARIAAYDTVEFDEFEKDADGYPTNWAAWKLDSQNEGYPWPTGFLPSHIVVGGIYKKVNGTFVPVQIYKKVNGTLVPAQLYKKVNGNLIPIL